MRKIGAILMVLVLGFVLVACGADTSTINMYVSPNKIVYNADELNNGIPVIDKSDFDLFAITKNNNVSKVNETPTVSATDVNNDNIFEVLVNFQGYNLKYNVYVNNGQQSSNDVALSVLSATYGLTEEEKTKAVYNLFWTPQLSKVNLTNVKVLSAKFNATSMNDSANIIVEEASTKVVLPENYEENIKKMNSENVLTFKFNDSIASSSSILNRTFKPIDNSLPISVDMENTFLGYVWDWLLIIPISFVMQLFASIFGNSFGFGILFATIIVRTVAWPIYAKTNDMSMKMAIAQPEMTRLQKKYETKKDPASQQKMQMEMMAIYKKHKISMFGCLTPILQMPLFLAMFQVVYRIAVPGGMYFQQVSNKNLFFGLVDLTKGGFNDPWSYVLAAIVGITMYLLQKLSAKKPSYAKNTGSQVKTDQAIQTEKTMKTVSTVMVAMMVFTTLSSVNALGFYWVVGNIYSIIQSIINRKLSERRYEKQKQSQLIV